MSYLICYKCNTYFEVDNEEETKEFANCECGQRLVYSEKLENSRNEALPKKSSTYTENMVFKYNLIIFLGILFILGGLLALLAGSIFLYFLIVGGVLVLYGYDNRYSWKRGDEGEKMVAEYLNGLHHSFIFHDVDLPNSKGNLDHVVVGKKGVFVIETKNYRGSFIIKGNKWFYQGRKLEKTKTNPGAQVKRNALSLRNYLNANGLKRNIWINGIVAFVSGEFKIQKKTDHYSVLRPSQLTSYIDHSRQSLDNKTILKLVNLLMERSADHFYRPEEWPDVWTS